MKTRIIHKLYSALRIQYSETVPGIPGFGTGSGTLEPVPWNRFLRQITRGQYWYFVFPLFPVIVGWVTRPSSP